MQSRIPEGLAVRALRPGDAAAFHALQNSPSVMRGHTHAPYGSLEETREWLDKLAPPAVLIGAWVGGTHMARYAEAPPFAEPSSS